MGLKLVKVSGPSELGSTLVWNCESLKNVPTQFCCVFFFFCKEPVLILRESGLGCFLEGLPQTLPCRSKVEVSASWRGKGYKYSNKEFLENLHKFFYI